MRYSYLIIVTIVNRVTIVTIMTIVTIVTITTVVTIATKNCLFLLCTLYKTYDQGCTTCTLLVRQLLLPLYYPTPIHHWSFHRQKGQVHRLDSTWYLIGNNCYQFIFSECFSCLEEVHCYTVKPFWSQNSGSHVTNLTMSIQISMC